MAARAGLAPAPVGLTNRRAPLTPSGKNWSARQDLHLRSPGPKPGMLLLHHAPGKPRPHFTREARPGVGECGTLNLGNQSRGEIPMLESGGPEGSRTLNSPADNGALCCLSYRSGMVGSAGNAPVVASGMFGDTRITAGLPDHLPRLVAGMGVTPIWRVYEARLCALVEFPAVKLNHRLGLLWKSPNMAIGNGMS
jgi:hypothetical protein